MLALVESFGDSPMICYAMTLKVNCGEEVEIKVKNDGKIVDLQYYHSGLFAQEDFLLFLPSIHDVECHPLHVVKVLGFRFSSRDKCHGY